MLALRSGNEVSLQLVEERLSSIASTAERTADELTHTRLRAEVETLQARMKPLRDRLYTVIGLCVLLTGPLLLAGLFLIKSWGFIAFLLAGILIAVAVLSAKTLNDHQLAQQERDVKARMRELQARLDGGE